MIAFSRKAASYCCSPTLRSHTARSMTAPSLVDHIINRDWRVVY